ncbi:MAG: radical SAM protein [Planctomycetota bacterium]
MSIGINLNPDARCNFDCLYCCADRSTPRPHVPIELAVLDAELRQLVAEWPRLFEEPEFRTVPLEFRRLNDIAFSGDGEPTMVPAFPEAVRIAVAVRADHALTDAKIIIITNACYLARAGVVEALELLDRHNGEIWAKLDAGTDEYHRLVNRGNVPLPRILEGLLATARRRPIVIQSLFMRVDGQPPPAAEIDAYVERLRWLTSEGARISLVQVYSVARRTADPRVAPLPEAELEAIAAQVRPLGLRVAVFA